MDHLHDSVKEKIIKSLAAQEKASRRLRECLSVQLKGVGILSSSAVRSAEDDWRDALEEVDAIASRSVRPEGLLQEGLEEIGLGEVSDQVDIGRGTTVTRTR